MTDKKRVILAHRGEFDGARAYEDVASPFDAERLLLLSLCAEMLAPERIIPQLRLSASGSRLCAMTVPVLEEKLAPGCKPGWTGEPPLASWNAGARCWEAAPPGGDRRASRGLSSTRRSRATTRALLDFLRRNRPGFAFLASSPPAVPVARLKRSGRSAAVFLGRFLFVQSRGRTLRPGDIDVLHGLDAPLAPAVAPDGEAAEGQRPNLEDEACRARIASFG